LIGIKMYWHQILAALYFNKMFSARGLCHAVQINRHVSILMVLIISMMEKGSVYENPCIWTTWRCCQPRNILLHSVATEASRYIDYISSYIHLRISP
jgi:hypothetical protein